MLLCIEYGILFVDTVDTKIKAYNALNAMFVNTVDTKIKAYNALNALCQHCQYKVVWVENTGWKESIRM